MQVTTGFEAVTHMIVQYDQKAVLSIQDSSGNIVLARYTAVGALDPTFGSGGVVSMPSLRYSSLDMAPDGKLVVAGTYTAQDGTNDESMAVARFIGGPLPAHPGTFEDVDPSSPFYAYIQCMYSRNIISGYTCGGAGEPCDAATKPYFRPGASMSRGQVAKVVSIAAGFNETPTTQTFQDVAPDSPFYPYIERMASRNIISGYTCGGAGEPCLAGNKPYFRPSSNVSRGQLTKIVSNPAGYSETPTTQTFQDVPPSNAFYLFVERLVFRQIMSGYACGGANEPCIDPARRGYFRPGLDVTRGQASKIVSNAFFPNCQAAKLH